MRKQSKSTKKWSIKGVFMIDVRKFIKENSDFEYKNFISQFTKTKFKICGVRIPHLRKFAKEIEPEYIELDNPNLTYEEILLYGFSASQFKNEDEQLEYLENLLPYIDDWSTCDEIVSSLKCLNNEKSYQKFNNLLDDGREYYVRVGIVGMMKNFIKTDKLEEILKKISELPEQEYYAKMAIAWLYAEICTFNFPIAKRQIEKTTDKFIRNRAISKANDSLRVTNFDKQELLKLKIKD